MAMSLRNQVGIYASLAFFVLFASPAWALRVIDDAGRVVELAQPAQRIVSLAPSITENLFSAGLGKRVVGTVDHSDYPSQALAIPRVGNYTTLNIEAILALKPDLVVAWGSGNPKHSITRLTEFGISVFISEAVDFSSILSNIRNLATLGGTIDDVEPALIKRSAEYDRLIKTNQSKTPVRVLYQVWNEPLITLNGGHFVSRAMEACQGVNIYANAPTVAPRVSVESVISMQPDIIILGGDALERANWRQAWIKWPALNAVANHQVVFINPDLVSRPTERLWQGTQQICELLDQVRLKKVQVSLNHAVH